MAIFESCIAYILYKLYKVVVWRVLFWRILSIRQIKTLANIIRFTEYSLGYILYYITMDRGETFVLLAGHL